MPPANIRPKSAKSTSKNSKSDKKIEKDPLSSSQSEALNLHQTLKFQYAFSCKRYATDPIPQIKKLIEDSSITGKPFFQILVNSLANNGGYLKPATNEDHVQNDSDAFNKRKENALKIKANDMVAISIAFKLYPHLKSIKIWHVKFLERSLHILVQFLLN